MAGTNPSGDSGALGAHPAEACHRPAECHKTLSWRETSWRLARWTVCSRVPGLARRFPYVSGGRPLRGGGRDLPEVAVRVAEVPEVAPLCGSGCLHDAATGRHGLPHDLVHRRARRTDVVERDPTEAGSLR